MKKTLLTIVLSTLLIVGGANAYTVVSGDTLFKIADKHNIGLKELILLNPQIENPNLIYPGQNIKTAVSTNLINEIFFRRLNNTLANSEMFGGTFHPVQVQDTYLSGSGISSTAVSITLTEFVFPDDSTVTMTDFGDIGYATLEPNTAREENISFTGITQNANGTATLTGVTRGLLFEYPYTTDSGYRFSHAGGTIVRFSNSTSYYSEFAIKRNDETISGVWQFDVYPVASSSIGYATTSWQLISLGQAQALTNQGAATSTYTVSGIDRLGTQIEMASSTYNVLDPTVISTRYSTSTPSANATDRALFVPITENDGYLNQGWLDLTEAWSFSNLTGTATYGDTLSFNSGAISGDLTVGGNIVNSIVPYYGDGSDGAVVVTTNDFFPNSASSTLALAVATSSSSITVSDASQFATSTYIFIHSVRGENAGNWEIKKVSDRNVDTDVVTLSSALSNAYKNTNGNNVTQILKVPQYTTVTFKGSGSIDPKAAWRAGDKTLGGVVVFYASKGVIIENGTTVSLSGFGYKGGTGAIYQGEGACGVGAASASANCNGGGGGIAGAGTGGNNIVDVTGDWFSNGHGLILGGGGGIGAGSSEGTGGDGGGVFMPITKSFINLGYLSVAGAKGGNGGGGNTGGGGGGAGGLAYILAEQIANLSSSTQSIIVSGGNGGVRSGTTDGHPGAGGGMATTGQNGQTGDDTGGYGGMGYVIQGWIEQLLPYN